MGLFRGAGVAIITPFTETGVDYDRFEKLLNWHVEQGTDAIVVCGTTGEASTMSTEEKKEAIRFTVEVINGRIPVIAGTGSNDTRATVEMSQYAQSAGADALLIINPYYNKTSNEGLYRHFEAVHEATGIPIVVYNVPSRTGMNITPEALVRLSTLERVVAVKEASGDISQVAKYRRYLPESFQIFSGNDDQILPIMALGGDGVISVSANIIPKVVHDQCMAFLNGDYKEALRIQMETLPLTNQLFTETNPIPLKAAMEVMGLDSGRMRLPLVPLSESNKKNLLSAMKDYGLIGE